MICRQLQNVLMHDMHAKVEIAFSRVFGGVGRRLEGLWLSPSYFLWKRNFTLFHLTQHNACFYLAKGDVSTRVTLLWTSILSRVATILSIATEIWQGELRPYGLRRLAGEIQCYRNMSSFEAIFANR